MNEDEIDTLLAALASEADVTALTQALLWCIDSRREWRRRALAAEAELDERDHARHQDTVG